MEVAGHNFALFSIFICCLIFRISAETLYVSHYSGTVSQLTLTAGQYGNYSLALQSSLTACGSMPSWLTLDSASKTLYCSDETLYGTPSLTSFAVDTSGAIKQSVKVTSVTGGGVNNAVYNTTSGKEFLAIAH